MIPGRSLGGYERLRSSEALSKQKFCGAMFLLITGIASAAAVDTTTSAWHGDTWQIRLNQITASGSHNSYHVASPDIYALLDTFDDRVWEWDYTHLPLPIQLTQGARVFELDLLYDPPPGGRYRSSGLMRLLGRDAELPDPDLALPGYKVAHVPDVDYKTTCSTLAGCLGAMRSWSLDHPEHVPIFVYLEYKYRPTLDFFGDFASFLIDLLLPDDTISDPLPVSTEALAALETEILTVFPREAIIVPDDVRSNGHATLEEAVLSGAGWPLLQDARGKVIFILGPSAVADVYRGMTARSPSLAGPYGPYYNNPEEAASLYARVCFTASSPGSPDAAFVVAPESDDVAANAVRARELVTQGYMLRMRLDQGVKPNPDARSAYFASGAQLLASDFLPATPQSDDRDGYVATKLPGAPCRGAQRNPVLFNETVTLERIVLEPYRNIQCTG
eukprot:jgi/Mesvir1/14761/Mv05402-RA.1